MRRGRDTQLEECFIPVEARPERGQARSELRQQEQAKQRRRLAARFETGDSRHKLLELRVGRRAQAHRLVHSPLWEGERGRPSAVARVHALARARHAQPGRGDRDGVRIGVAPGRAAQGGHAQCREVVVAQKEAEQME